ncbi:hypothetical protein EIP91_000952 [Steccherinum ochraceum]|uniref:Uncharacterized protein n=1 Tax=Steccherinum ochraceum TaxID=92696 RepID=A0A4R0RF05_9APHY|nr:hypothetical protein EIP91_000952 [Steccherinum ochraceum]
MCLERVVGLSLGSSSLLLPADQSPLHPPSPGTWEDPFTARAPCSSQPHQNPSIQQPSSTSASHSGSLPATNTETFLELVSNLEHDLDRTQRSLRQATQALEATFRRLINSRNIIRGNMNTMPSDSLPPSDTPAISNTSAMGPPHSALVISPPHSPSSSSSSADTLRILLDTVERQSYWMDDPPASDSLTRSPSPTSLPPQNRPPRSRYTTFFGPRHETVRPRPSTAENPRRPVTSSANNASTSLGRRVAARAAAGSPSGSRTPGSGDSATTSHVAELAVTVDDAISRLNRHRAELLAASSDLRLRSHTATAQTSAPTSLTQPMRAAASFREFLERRQVSSAGRDQPEPVSSSSRTRPTAPRGGTIDPALTLVAAPSPPTAVASPVPSNYREQAQRVYEALNLSLPPTAPAPGPPATGSTTTSTTRQRSARRRRHPFAHVAPEDLPSYIADYNARNLRNRATEIVSRNLGSLEGLPPLPDDIWDPDGNPFASSRANSWGGLDQNGDEVPTETEEDYELNRTRMRTRARQLQANRGVSTTTTDDRIEGTTRRTVSIIPVDARPRWQAEPDINDGGRMWTVPSPDEIRWVNPMVRMPPPVDDRDRDDDPVTRHYEYVSQRLRTRPDTSHMQRVESHMPMMIRRNVPRFQASALPLPLVCLDAAAEPLGASRKRSAVQSAGVKSIRVSHDCFAGR